MTSSDNITQRQSKLSVAKRALLERLRSGEGHSAAHDAIPCQAVRDRGVLSFAQQRLWFLDQLAPGKMSYSVPLAERLIGELDAEALRRSLSALVERHEALRTTFQTEDGRPIQIITAPQRLDLPLIDLSELPPNERETEARRYVETDAQSPFDLARGPLLRAQLVRLSDREHVLVLNMHHIVSDGWSMRVLFRELGALYEGFASGSPVSLPVPAMQYADYAAWQRDWLQGEALERLLGYWKQKLDGAPALELSTDRPRPAVQTFPGAHCSLVLPGDVSDALKRLSREEGMTMFMTLLAAFKVLLARYSGQEDVVVGTPIANRNRAQVESVIGFFVNTLVMRTDLSGNPSFRELLARVRQGALDAYAHQDLPFEKLVEELQPERDLSRSPLFQVFFNMVDLSEAELTLPPLTVEPLRHLSESAKFDLTCYVFTGPGRVTAQLMYNTDLFDGTTIERMLRHFRTLLEGIVADSRRRISELPLLAGDEQRAATLRRNRVRPIGPWPSFEKEDIKQSIAQRFGQQVQKYAGQIAVKTPEVQRTYASLHRAANRIARSILHRCGSGEGNVALLFEHGADMIAAMLGVLKAGKAYVPLDPSYPETRLRWMLSDSQAVALVTNRLNRTLADALGGNSDGCPRIDIDDMLPETRDDVDIEVPVSPDSLAYILYTSGSTGMPKGVMQSHRNVLHHIRVYSKNLRITASDRLTLLSSYGFDASVMDIYGALLNGATLYPMTIRDRSAGELWRWMDEQQISIYHSTPSAYRYLLGSLGADRKSPHMRLVVLGGEEAVKRDVELHRKHFGPHCTLINGLGPTESTLALQNFVDHQDVMLRHSVSVGYPVEETEIVLLDAAGRRSSISGEMTIRSPHVALGYWRRPELTARAFVPDPEGGAQRTYRTGDMGRLLPDGTLQFAGRQDRQVKLGGFRIELGEIEELLEQHAEVSEAVVLPLDGPASGEKRLVAYVVPTVVGARQHESLQEYLRQKLPAYMVPSAVITLETLPLSPHGKLDHRALPQPDWQAEQAGRELVLPRSDVEEGLAEIWSEVLGHQRMGIHDNFFSLGGHSLLATRVMSRIPARFSVDIPLRAIFEHPTIAGLGAEIEAARLGQAKAILAPIKPLARDGSLPLSFAQERLWILDQIVPNSPRYNMPAALRLEGTLNQEALQQSLDELVSRHETLRTTFRAENHVPAQVMGDAVPVEMPLVDLSPLEASEAEAEAQRLAAEEAIRPFDLARGPLLRARLVRLSDKDHVLFITLHHIVSDGWSMGVLNRDLGALYESFSRQAPSPLPKPVIQYADFAAWQRQALRDDVLLNHLAYWKDRLVGAPALELPTDRPRPAVPTYRGSVASLALPKALSDAIISLSHQEGATLFMTMLAAFKTLLFRYTGQDDIVVGSPIANRNRPEIENLIGFFVNMLVMRTPLRGDLSFRQLIARVRDVALGAYAHQDLPFEKLVEEVSPERDRSRNPLFQVSFAVQNAPRPPLELGALKLSRMQTKIQTTRFDLEAYVWETPQGLHVAVLYSTDLFDAPTVERMLRHYQTLLEHAVSDPDGSIRQVPLMSESERREIVVDRNRTARRYPRDVAVHMLFERQVELDPDAVAVESDEERLSYRELNNRSNQLARHLNGLGISGPDDMVGVFLDRSADMVVALLGVLKAGAAYVPLDLEYPTHRLEFMLDDTKAHVLLTHSALESKAPRHSGHVVYMDTQWPTIARASHANLENNVNGDSLAYVIYTSGSTGAPKGACIAHRSINRLICNTDYVTLDPSDRIAQVSNCSFDAATFEIWGALLSGARLVIIPREVVLSPSALAAELRERGITTMFLTTALFNQIAREAPGAFASMRQMLFGGEACDPQWVRSVLEHGPPQRLLHVYGPTETTTFASWYQVQSVAPGATNVPIGRPIANTELHVLDGSLNAVPIGVSGELYIGGDGLARAYLNASELTAQKFVPHPLSDEPGARLYRTGDVVRYLPDGNIQFLGRRDGQVKLRGFRIEIGEIETALLEHPKVREAVVLLREDEPGQKRLVAYVAPDRQRHADGLNPTHARHRQEVFEQAYQQPSRESSDLVPQLRSHARGRLPNYMIPSDFVVLDSLPLNVNGKVDLKSLPAPVGDRHVESSYVAPQTPTQQAIAKLWCEVLRLDNVGVHDNFFELGGHSLLATQVISRLRDQFQIGLALASLFDGPTVAELAERVEVACGFEQGHEVPPVVRMPRDGTLPLSFAQQRLWFVDQMVPDRSVYNVSAVLRLEGPLNRQALEQSMNDLVRRHEVLRTSFKTLHGGHPIQVIAEELCIDMTMTDLTSLADSRRESEARRVVERESLEPFDLERGPLLRVHLIQLGRDEHVLLLSMHHIVSDGWSLGVLFSELGAFYAAHTSGSPSPLGDLELQYADYASWQRDYLRGDVLSEHLEYWRGKLAGAPLLELPTDRVRPAVQQFHGARESLTLSEGLSQALEELSRREGVTLFMTLLAAFKALLHRYSAQEDIVIGSPIAGRSRPEFEGLIGFFVNMLVLRTDLSGDPTFRELLRREREVALGAYEREVLPFEKLVEELDPQRDMSRNPLFQATFALQNAPLAPLALGDLRLSAVSRETQVTRFDLEAHVWEHAQGLRVDYVYSTALFESATIRRMLVHFQRLLAEFVANPDQRLSGLSLLTGGERKQIVSEWNRTETAYPRDATIHELFAAQADRSPDAVAVIDGERRLSYGQLNTRANRLAHELRREGVGPDVLVALCVERGLEMVVGMLGILKAGGAYVPLDSDYPKSRLSFMLEDTSAPVLVTQRHLVDQLPAYGGRLLLLVEDGEVRGSRFQVPGQDGGSLVLLDDEREGLCGQSEGNPPSETRAENLAYVIYTSGSTGHPKGVSVPHRAVIRLVLNTDYVSLTSSDVMAQASNASFDAATFEVWGSLLSGGRLVIVDRETLLAPRRFASSLREHGVTTLFVTTALFNQMAREVPGVFATLRQVLFGGEACDPRQVQAVLEADPPQRLLHVYGPTENTTFTTWQLVESVPEEARTVPIGRPIANTRVYVLDQYGHPVPVGVPGELYIGGDGLAREYLKREELTGAKFVSDPYDVDGLARQPGKADVHGEKFVVDGRSRLYRTGDVCRWLGDGTLEFVGRQDDQVKLRGFRVELGEVEAALLEHDGISAALVMLREDEPGDKRLVGYVMARAGARVSESELRGFLKEQLPGYMVPSAVVLMESFPLTANGKIDKQALPRPDGVRETDGSYVAPQSDAEQRIAAIWQEILQLDKVGVQDNFFELGGHSLMATQVKSRIDDAFDVELSIRSFFSGPTVRELAAAVEAEILRGLGELSEDEAQRLNADVQ